MSILNNTIIFFTVFGQNTFNEIAFAGAAIYDIDFNPHLSTQFSAVSDNGRVAVWDLRRCDRAEKHWLGHSEYTFTCRWHPEVGWTKNSLKFLGWTYRRLRH